MYIDSSYQILHESPSPQLKVEGERAETARLFVMREDKWLSDITRTPCRCPSAHFVRRKGCLTLDTDVCDRQTGCVLTQEQPYEAKKPFSYWSGTLKASEQTYDTSDRESLAMVWAITFSRRYLEGHKFIICIKHDALKWILNLADHTGQLDARGCDYLNSILTLYTERATKIKLRTRNRDMQQEVQLGPHLKTPHLK